MLLRKHPGASALIIYLLFFGLLFVQYPLSDSLVGNTDAIASLTIYKEHILKLKALVFNQQSGNTFYPESGITSYCESYVGETFFYAAFKLLGFSDFHVVYILIALFYSLNAFSVYCLCKIYLKKEVPAFLGGLAFSSSCYMLGNQEMMNALLFFPTPLALVFFERFLLKGKTLHLFLCVIFISLQFYFSFYNILYAILLVAVFAALNASVLFHDALKRPFYYAGAFILLIALVAPLFTFIIISDNFRGAFNPAVQIPGLTERFSFTLKNFLSSYPNNLIYQGGIREWGGVSLANEYYANLGIVFWICCLIGLFQSFKYKWVFVAIALVSTLISFGLYLDVFGYRITMPLTYLYKIEMFKWFYRIPGRTFVVGVFALSVLFAAGIVRITQNQKRGPLIAVALIVIFLFENLPFPFPLLHNRNALVPPKQYLSFFEKQKMKVTADVPSSLFTNRFQYVNNISEYSREYRYMYWQTLHRNHTINGSVSYFPNSRMRNNDLLKDITINNNLAQLIATNQLDYLTFHKKLVLAKEETNIDTFLMHSPMLDKQLENEEIVIYKVKKQ